MSLGALYIELLCYFPVYSNRKTALDKRVLRAQSAFRNQRNAAQGEGRTKTRFVFNLTQNST